ncbi:Putative UDP-kanosamine synthase oxidoreductase subunit [Thiorhodovibrio winogradskyi]|uniref:UDP-kanosamine synthase oxidoreductase subunit n=1 Tax=Thiorhodovibrio winogradskyi TaxID=77007 RepID=A0ABZ0SC44_9GAMM|nr:Gfo/Idh/MocA family oxidoreductase [Thiorhodovibrio winogradskyi]
MNNIPVNTIYRSGAPPQIKLPLRVAVIGCGSFAEQFHLPVLAGHDDIKLAALVDRDSKRLSRLATAYGVPIAVEDQSDLSVNQIDAAILATPPVHHRDGAIDLLQRGIHVLVEKPMALHLADAEAMCAAADDSGVVLAVGVYKRLLPVIRFVKQLLQEQRFGKPLRCTASWGGIGGYGSATLALMKKELAGGGVLMDLGPHLLDILTYWFGEDGRVLEYRDDARGGIEADCDGLLGFQLQGVSVEVDFHLSRARNLDSGFRVECETATLEFGVTERFEITVYPSVGASPYLIRPTDVDTGASWFEPFRAEIDDWLGAIVAGKRPELDGRSCLASLRLIEECYSKRQSLDYPWLIPDHQSPSATPVTAAHAAHSFVRATKAPRRVLITGAGGFIGSRASELLFASGNWQIRGQIRRPASASRLARLPIEMIQADLRSESDVARMVDGCDAVVHCAVGTDYGQNRSIYEVTVGGTKRLVDAAKRAGVQRFVHLSSIGVNDPDAHSVISHDTPMHSNKDDWYGYTKGLAERATLAAADGRFCPVILRPGCVYGPYGFTFVMNPLAALVQGRLVLADSSDLPSNTVYVDNLAHAICLALEGDEERICGEIAVISDEPNWTWGQYFGFFADALGVPLRTASAPTNDLRAKRIKPEHAKVLPALVSAEAKQFAKRLLRTDPLGTLPRLTMERFPASERWLRKLLKMDAPEIYRRPPSRASRDMVFTSRKGAISLENAKQALGYHSLVDPEQAMAVTLQWAYYAGVVPREKVNR